jgi:dienelactone hydrolase
MERPSEQGGVGELVHVTVDFAVVEADLRVPDNANGVVVFAHGRGSDRHSPDNNFVAEKLRRGGLATLLIDLPTPQEKKVDRRTRRIRFDIDRLARRVMGVADWLASEPATEDLRIGIFGSSIGAAAALVAAAERPDHAGAIVSRGGQVHLAEGAVEEVEAPTLLIVGGNDRRVLDLNRQALARLEVEKKLKVIPGAGLLFREAGALDEVGRLACERFQRHLT